MWQATTGPERRQPAARHSAGNRARHEHSRASPSLERSLSFQRRCNRGGVFEARLADHCAAAAAYTIAYLDRINIGYAQLQISVEAAAGVALIQKPRQSRSDGNSVDQRMAHAIDWQQHLQLVPGDGDVCAGRLILLATVRAASLGVPADR
jgi:hypothetical protein